MKKEIDHSSNIQDNWKVNKFHKTEDQAKITIQAHPPSLARHQLPQNP